VLLGEMERRADDAGALTIYHEADREDTLGAALVSGLAGVTLRLSATDRTSRVARMAMAFVKSFSLTVTPDMSLRFGVDFDDDPLSSATLLTGMIDQDLPTVMEHVGKLLRDRGESLCIFIDEVQSVSEGELRALLKTMQLIARLRLPVFITVAGMPQLPGQVGSAKTYAERLFDVIEVGSLVHDDAVAAIIRPAQDAGVTYAPAAVERLVDITEGYPYFIQEYGKMIWDTTVGSLIDLEAIEPGLSLARAELNRSFFMTRFQRCTAAERDYLLAMARLSRGERTSGKVATAMGVKVTSLSGRRDSLIAKGMIWSPDYGVIDFTVPQFDRFITGIMPSEDSDH
jgi:hypothetical protein